MTDITFSQLKKNCRREADTAPTYRVAVLGNCATQHLAAAIRGYAVEEGLRFVMFDADYDQIEAQLRDPGSELFSFNPEFVLFYICAEKLYTEFTETADRRHFAEQIRDRICGYWSMLSKKSGAKILQFTFAEPDDGVFGNYACKAEDSFLFQIRKLNYLMMEAFSHSQQAFPVDLNGILSRAGMDGSCGGKLYYIAKMPLSTAILPEVARQVTQVIKTLTGRFKKCVITDLDNTLWGGVIGDDGLEGIQIGELGTGHAFEDLQRWLKELKRRGIMLAVCSKNEEAAAKLPFEKHPEMILHLDDFVVFTANWEDKASNIRNMQQTMNIGMDSIVFLDDNPFERNLVRENLPGITVPELPEDPAEYLPYLRSCNLFETASFSEEDMQRTRQYQEEARRVSEQENFKSYDEYLENLEMVAEAGPFDPFQYPRIAQLTQRSNQFNLRTVRCTQQQVEELAKSDRFLTLSFSLKDRFGDHGLISVVILEKADDATLFMYNWLMSCRVLKRGMEEFIINTVMETARREGFETVIGEYIQTPKNAMVRDIYERMGFERLDETHFRADVSRFEPMKTFIHRQTG